MAFRLALWIARYLKEIRNGHSALLPAKAVCERPQYPADFVLLVHEQRMFWSKPEAGFRCWEL